MRITKGFNEVYLAAQLHFHWGTIEVPGSEHTIDNIHFPAEVRISNSCVYNVHSWNTLLHFINKGISVGIPVDLHSSCLHLVLTLRLIALNLFCEIQQNNNHIVIIHFFPFKIHVVHYNSKYANMTEAASKADGLAVLGGFIGVSHALSNLLYLVKVNNSFLLLIQIDMHVKIYSPYLLNICECSITDWSS